MIDAFIGRQPIFDRQLRVYAYELLFRPSSANQANILDGDRATSQVILNTVTAIGLERIIGTRRAFINLTRSFVLDNRPLPFSRNQVALEILEDIEVDQELLEGVKRLANMGYFIALDDFLFHESLRPLVELADLIKIDLRAADRSTVAAHVSELRPYGVKLLAEKVETQEEFAFCRELGFDYFQGYFLCRPKVIKGRRLPANRVAILRLVSELQKPDIDVHDIEKTIGQDLSLSYKLLRYINCAAFSPARKIESIRQAIVLMGTDAIKRWATLLALAEIDDKPHELMTSAMVRGKMCEHLALLMGHSHLSSFFTVGLFSVLDALMDLPLEQILPSLPISDEIAAALLRYEGPLGEVLHSVAAYERGDWDVLTGSRLTPAQASDTYLQSIHWADETLHSLSGPQ